jgi:hypothetical protein
MKLTAKNTVGKNVVVKDGMGRPIPGINAFNTKTCEAKLFLCNRHGGFIVKKSKGISSVIKVTVKIPGAYAEIDGKKVK